MFIIVEFVGDDTFTHIVDTDKFDPALKQDVESKVLNDPCFEFDSKYFTSLKQGVIAGRSIFPLIVHGNTTVYID